MRWQRQASAIQDEIKQKREAFKLVQELSWLMGSQFRRLDMIPWEEIARRAGRLERLARGYAARQRIARWMSGEHHEEIGD